MKRNADRRRAVKLSKVKPGKYIGPTKIKQTSRCAVTTESGRRLPKSRVGRVYHDGKPLRRGGVEMFSWLWLTLGI